MSESTTKGIAIVITIAFVIGLFLILGELREHGISSCEKRSGVAVTRSWLSENPWDVSCIEVKK